MEQTTKQNETSVEQDNDERAERISGAQKSIENDKKKDPVEHNVKLGIAFLKAVAELAKERSKDIDWDKNIENVKVFVGEKLDGTEKTVSGKFEQLKVRIQDEYEDSKLQKFVEGTYEYTVKNLQKLADHFDIDLTLLKTNDLQSADIDFDETSKTAEQAYKDYIAVATDYIYFSKNRPDGLEEKYNKVVKALEAHYGPSTIASFKKAAKSHAKDKKARKDYDPLDEIVKTASEVGGKVLGKVTGKLAEEGTKQTVKGAKETLKGIGKGLWGKAKEELDKRKPSQDKGEKPNL